MVRDDEKTQHTVVGTLLLQAMRDPFRRERDAFSIILARLAERRSIRDPEGPRRDCRSLAHADRNTTPVNSG